MTEGIYNTRFIYYDESGKIYEIRPYPPTDDKLYLEVDFSLVEEFLFGPKSYANYNITYFLNLKNGIVSNNEIVVSEEKSFLHNIPLTNSTSNEITLEHYDSFWRIVIRDDILDKSKLFNSLDFFVCKKDDPEILYKHLQFNLKNSYNLEFTLDIEKDLNLISVLTEKKFKSYGIKELTNE